MDIDEQFTGKKVTVMGLGLLGRGVGDVAFLAEHGAEVLVTDLKDATVLAPSIAMLALYPNITYVLGEHRLEDFEGRDFILKAAGVPIDSPYIAHAREKGVAIKMSAAMFAELSGVPMIGVTGTRGKSTVTHMIDHVLREVTEDAGTGGVILGGNVRGVSNLQLLEDVGPDSLAVFELDSWQLQGFGDAKISPQVAVFTSFMPDHMNYYLRTSERSERMNSFASERGTEASSAYHDALDAYFADKAQIFLHQTSKDVFVTTAQVFGEATAYAQKHGLTLGGEVLLADVSALPEDFSLAMPGEHNRLNAALAVEALRALSLPDELIFAGLKTFRGVPGRLELLGEKKGVRIYNDNNATTPEATVQGLRAVAEGKNVVLIAGGADKDLPLEVLAREIGLHTKEVFLIPGTGTDKLTPLIPSARSVSTLEEAVARAFEAAENGDVILFSPGFASFGMFQNEYERNDAFVALVRATL